MLEKAKINLLFFVCYQSILLCYTFIGSAAEYAVPLRLLPFQNYLLLRHIVIYL